MRVQTEARLPLDMAELVRQLTRLHSDLSRQLNGISEGRIAAATNANTAAPTTGVWQQGDFLRNSAPTEAGSAGSKYVVLGWACVASGEPGTWVAARCLTGN
jgi:hypothetical protein